MSKNKVYFVYVLTNVDTNETEYIGVTSNPKSRFSDHTHKRPSEKHRHGKFWGRKDIEMQLVSGHPSLGEAMRHERKLKILKGFPPTEYDKSAVFHKAKGIRVYNNTTGEFIEEFYSMREVCRVLGVNRGTLRKVMSNGVNTIKDFHFDFC